MLNPNAILNERYRLIEQIGAGGMATVWSAQDLRLGRTVAVKVLHPEYARDDPFLQRFQQEAEFAASLGAHPNVVAIYDIGQDDQRRYIVMELVEGRSLKELIAERAPFSVPEAFDIGRQVASALDFAHKRGLVHRDVKPQNIMVTPSGVAKVTDFGIARSLSASQLTRTGMVIGTVHYFSPEQAQGKQVTPSSDIYSLGIILYEMLTAHLPFEAENAIGVAMQHLHTEPPSLLDYNPSLPPRAVAIVLRALEKDPARRYPDAAAFAEALAGQAITQPTGGTTTLSPIPVPPEPAEQTARFPPAERRVVMPPARQYVARETPTTARAVPPPNRWRTAWMTMGLLALALLIAAAAFLASKNVFGGGSTATPTPSPTSTPRPSATPGHHKRHRRPTVVPTIPVVVQPTQPPAPVFQPTYTPIPPNPPTSTPQPPPPTATSEPPPTRPPAPTASVVPPTPAAPTDTPEPIPGSIPSITDTPTG